MTELRVVFEEQRGLRNAAAIIIIKLTVSCLIAAFLMGLTFLITFDAKRRNEQRDFERTVYELLGYSKTNPAPSDLKLHVIYRYVISRGDAANVGYMLPVERDNKEKYELLVIDSRGRLLEHPSLDISPAQASQGAARKAALKDILGSSSSFIYVDSTLVATQGKKRIAYLVRREFSGFKSLIRVLVALDPSFKIIGLEIMEDEEDPGLGAEIKEDYFKKQFRGRRYEKVKKLKVTKEPMPEAYRAYLEGKTAEAGLSRKDVEEIRRKFVDADIYAITGATISSRAVTDGVKNAVEKFHYRIHILQRIVAEQNIPAIV
jgi:electron transport complex protein RnfG